MTKSSKKCHCYTDKGKLQCSGTDESIVTSHLCPPSIIFHSKMKCHSWRPRSQIVSAASRQSWSLTVKWGLSPSRYVSFHPNPLFAFPIPLARSAIARTTFKIGSNRLENFWNLLSGSDPSRLRSRSGRGSSFSNSKIQKAKLMGRKCYERCWFSWIV